jgi:hypothetical protein
MSWMAHNPSPALVLLKTRCVSHRSCSMRESSQCGTRGSRSHSPLCTCKEHPSCRTKCTHSVGNHPPSISEAEPDACGPRTPEKSERLILPRGDVCGALRHASRPLPAKRYSPCGRVVRVPCSALQGGSEAASTEAPQTQSRAEQSRAEQSRAEQSRAEQSRADTQAQMPPPSSSPLRRQGLHLSLPGFLRVRPLLSFLLRCAARLRGLAASRSVVCARARLPSCAVVCSCAALSMRPPCVSPRACLPRPRPLPAALAR